MWMGADGLRQCEHRQRVGEPGTSACCNTVGKRAGLPYVLASRDPGAYNNQGGLPYQPYHTPVSRIYQWTVSAERQFGGFMTEAAYVGSHANGLQFQAGINQVPAGLLGQGQSARPYPQYKAIGPAYSGSLISLFSNISNYDSLQLSVRKRLGHGLTGEANYTWSKMLDDQDTSSWASHYGVAVYQNAYTTGTNYGLSNFDTPQAFKGYLVYTAPLGKGHGYLNHGIGDAVLGGWELSGEFVAQSGAPFTAYMASSTNADAVDGFWYPNLVGNPNVSNRSINQWFNQLAFATPQNNTFGTWGETRCADRT